MEQNEQKKVASPTEDKALHINSRGEYRLNLKDKKTRQKVMSTINKFRNFSPAI